MRKYLFVLLFAICSLTACSNLNNIFESDSQNENDFVSGLPCTIEVSVSPDMLDNAKLIAPGNLRWDEIAKIILLVNNSEFKKWESKNNKSAYEIFQSDSKIDFTSGTYDFEIQLFNNKENVLANGKIPNKTIYSDNPNYLSFSTERTVLSENGNIYIEFNWKQEDNIGLVQTKIFDYQNPSKEIKTMYCYPDNAKYHAVYNVENLKPGKYYFTYIPHNIPYGNNSYYPIKTVTDVLVVESGRTTNAVLNITTSDVVCALSYNLGSNGTFKEGFTPVSSKNPNEEIALPTKDDIICNDGYEFLGWFYNENCYGKKLTVVPKELYTSTTMYAAYTKIITAGSLQNELFDLKNNKKYAGIKIKGDGVTSLSSISSVLRNSNFKGGSGFGVYLDLSECTGVTEVPEDAFKDCYELVSVILPESITTIKKNAFYYAWYITSLYIPETVTTLEPWALANMRTITEIKLPSGIKEIPEYLCNGCNELKKINIPDGVTSIGKSAFQNAKIETIDIPSSVKSIGEWAFAATQLKEVTIPEGITSIADSCFWACFNLTKVNLPESLETIGNSAFQLCAAEITIPKNVVTIGDDAFNRCENIKDVVFSDKLKKIGHKAFADCSIKEVYIPETIESIGYGAFACPSLEKISVSSSNTKYDSRDNCNAIIETSSKTLLQACKNTVIPDGIEKIHGAYLKSNAKEINIPETVKEIDSYSFSECSELESIIIPASVTSVGDYVFSDSIKLKKIEFKTGDGTLNKTISTAFNNCVNLEELILPGDLNDLAGDFQGCYNLKKITLPNIASINQLDFSSLENILETITFLGTEAEWAEKSQRMNIPDGVKVICSDTQQ